MVNPCDGQKTPLPAGKAKSRVSLWPGKYLLTEPPSLRPPIGMHHLWTLGFNPMPGPGGVTPFRLSPLVPFHSLAPNPYTPSECSTYKHVGLTDFRGLHCGGTCSYRFRAGATTNGLPTVAASEPLDACKGLGGKLSRPFAFQAKGKKAIASVKLIGPHRPHSI